MRVRSAAWALIGLVALSGCLGNASTFKPGTDFKETGRTIHLRMWVEDLTNAPIYPGLNANLWAYCAAAADPSDAASQAAIEYRDQAGNVSVASQGKCSVPGPTLRVQQGDKVIVDFENTHVHAHTIHWHGQLVANQDDGSPGTTQDSVKPGETYRYEFIAKKAGTLWYHCHVDTQFHVMQGLYGAFIVEPQNKALEPVVVKDYTLVLGTLRRAAVEAKPAGSEPADPHAAHRAGASCGVTGNQGCQNPSQDVTPDVFMINGRSYPSTLDDAQSLLRVQAGQAIRLRFVNAGETFETLHLHGHDLYVTHRDGNPLPEAARFYVDTLTIGPGERYDAVVEGGNPGVWLLHTHVNSHETNDSQSPGGMQTVLVDGDHAGELEAFKAELPGGKPRAEPLLIPEDFADSTHVVLDSSTTATATWSFPVALPCAVKSIKLSATVRASDVALQKTNDLTFTVKAPDATIAVQKALGSTEYAEWTQAYPGGGLLQKGTYAVDLTGRAVSSSVDFAVAIHYFADEASIKTAGIHCAQE